MKPLPLALFSLLLLSFPFYSTLANDDFNDNFSGSDSFDNSYNPNEGPRDQDNISDDYSGSQNWDDQTDDESNPMSFPDSMSSPDAPLPEENSDEFSSEYSPETMDSQGPIENSDSEYEDYSNYSDYSDNQPPSDPIDLSENRNEEIRDGFNDGVDKARSELTENPSEKSETTESAKINNQDNQPLVKQNPDLNGDEYSLLRKNSF